MDLVAPAYGLIYWQLTGLMFVGFWIYALIDMIRSDFKDQNQKLIWALVLLIVPFFGVFIYLSMSRRTKLRSNYFNQKIDKKINFRKS